MSFLNRFRKTSETAQNPNKSPNNWELASNADFEAQAQLGAHEAQQTAEQLANQARQERKMISALLYDPSHLNRLDATISDREREIVYERLSDGRINEEHKSQILCKILTPFQKSPERTIDNLSSKHERRILTYLSGTGFDYWESASIYDLQNVLSRFPTPYELAQPEQTFLDQIRTNNSPEKYAEYQEAMESFKRKAYGKRYEYYNTLESLQHKAEQKHTEQDLRTKVLDTYTQSESPSKESIIEKVKLRQLRPEEQQTILQESRVDGDQFIYEDTAYRLTPSVLETLGLSPKYSFELQNAKINLSDPYAVDSKTAVTAYVQTDQGTNVCSYYRSNSQGIWRLLPDYVADSSKKAISPVKTFGKGYNEESLNLPSETQYALELVSHQGTEVPLDPINAEFALAGTAKRYESIEDYMHHREHHTLRGQHYATVADKPSFNLGQQVSHSKAKPESLDLIGSYSPNFQENQSPYITSTGLYGQVHVDHFPSKDGSMRYVFNRNADNQAWLSYIEIQDTQISPFGLHTKWASAGDYGTPLYEYNKQADGYGDPNDKCGHYVNMWKNYLSRMPLIQKYLSACKS